MGKCLRRYRHRIEEGAEPIHYIKYTIFSCPIDDILKGVVAWNEVFTFEDCR